MKASHFFSCILAAVSTYVACAPQAGAQTLAVTGTEPPAAVLPRSVQHELQAAVDRGLAWMAAAQQADGNWSNPGHPALTALALQCFLLDNSASAWPVVISNATRFLLAHVQADGGIYAPADRQGGGLKTYNTAVSLTVLFQLQDPDLQPVLSNARRFVARSKHLGDDVYQGEFGYASGAGEPYVRLLTTFHAAEALAITRPAADPNDAPAPPVDIDWSATVDYFVPPETHEPPPAARATFRTYGSMTYAGLLAMIYADLSREDVRVRTAFDWAVNNWSLNENPGMGQQGLFFFYHVLTKALNAFGEERLPLADGTFLNWRLAMAEKLLSLQRIDPRNGYGYWRNDEDRFWESDPVLVTAYSLIALQLLP